MNKISPIERIKQSIEIFVNNIYFLTSVIIILLTCSVIFSTIQKAMLSTNSLQWLIFSLASNLFTMGISLGVSYAIISLVLNKKVSLNTIFQKFDLVPQYLFASIIFIVVLLIAMLPGLIILLTSIDINSIMEYDVLNSFINNGKLLNLEFSSLNTTARIGIICIVIGFSYSYIRLQFYQYGIIHRQLTPIQSLIESVVITNNYSLELALLFIILVGINILGGIFIIGLLFTFPISMISLIKTYLFLLKNNNQSK